MLPTQKNGFCEIHKARINNSIYFDYSDLRSFHESEEGIANRTKIRLRYYGVQNDYDILKFTLEIKKSNPYFKTKIKSIIGEGTEVLQSLQDRQTFFDLIFIDADKNNYDNYYELCLKLITSNGLIIIDNMLWGGDVADLTITDKSTKSIRVLNKKILEDTRVEFSLLPFADGLSLIRKK